jgi:imidazolonepropionase-like amidohydrolase
MFGDSRSVPTLPVLVFATVAAACQTSPPADSSPTDTRITALTGVRVIDGTGKAAIEQATIVITDGTVTAVGPTASMQLPASAEHVDMSGKTVVPGFINAHGHLQKGVDSTIPVRDDLTRRLRTYAEYGVTSVLSLGSNPEDEIEGLTLRDEQNTIALTRARVQTSGPSLRRFKSAEEARAAVNRLADKRVDIIKFHFEDGANAMSPDAWGAIIDQAHARGLRAAAHIFFLKDAKAAVARGIDIIAHSVRDQDVDAAFIDEMKRRNVGYVATLTRDLSVFQYESTPAYFQDPFFMRGMALYGEDVPKLSDPGNQQRVRSDKQAQAIKPALAQAERNLKMLSNAGVAIAMGTDSGAVATPGRWQGYFEHVELEMMVAAGLSPMQAIVAATGTAARVAGFDTVGTITPGKSADLLVLDADPLQDIRNTRQINSVWVGGQRLAMGGTN